MNKHIAEAAIARIDEQATKRQKEAAKLYFRALEGDQGGVQGLRPAGQVPSSGGHQHQRYPRPADPGHQRQLPGAVRCAAHGLEPDRAGADDAYARHYRVRRLRH